MRLQPGRSLTPSFGGSRQSALDRIKPTPSMEGVSESRCLTLQTNKVRYRHQDILSRYERSLQETRHSRQRIRAEANSALLLGPDRVPSIRARYQAEIGRRAPKTIKVCPGLG